MGVGCHPGAAAVHERELRARRSAARRGLTVFLGALAVLAPGPSCPPSSAADVFDPDEPPETRYQLAPFLTFGAFLEFSYEYGKNLALNGRPDNAEAVFAPELSLAFSFDPDPRFQAYLNVSLSRPFVWKTAAGQPKPRDDVELELLELYAWLRSLPGGFSLQVGRQRFEDERQWLYDEELDAIRLRYRRESLSVELSLSQDALVRKNLLRPDDGDGINNYVLYASYGLREELVLDAFVIVRDDQSSPERRRPVFLGVRSRGEPVEDLDYWLDLGYVAGWDSGRRLHGWGVDVGATYEFQVGPKPALTLGLAFGSGDGNPSDGTDRSFRQTGLQENESDFGGATDFKYYGEVLDPELSNLLILTAGIGIHPSDKFSLDLVYHYYLQHHAAASLRDSGIDAEPSGRSRRLGSAVDLVLGLQEIYERLEVRAVLGYFSPGAAFSERNGAAWVVRAEMQFRF